MSGSDFTPRENFGSRFGIIAAAAGSAVGLGNIWRFPYVVGENGGGAFLIIYLVFIIAIGLPVMLSEFTIGRKGQRNAIGSFRKLAPGTPWYLVGVMGVAAAFLILSFYSAVAGWTLEYVFKSVTNSFAGHSDAGLNLMFGDFISGTWRPLFWQLVFMILTAWIVAAGVKKGIEKYTKVLMPVLILMIIILCVRSVTLPGAAEGIAFLFKPDFSAITADAMLSALGQAFFSLSLGMGTLITYGSYIGRKENLPGTVVQVSAADTIIALMAGVAIFPAVFAFGIDPGEGPGLVFITLPNIFLQMPGGYFFALIFFILLAIAALTSSISVLEVVVAYFVEELRLTRKMATVFASVMITVLGVFCTLSFGIMSDVSIFGMDFFNLMEFTASDLLLPLGGFFIVMFVGWYLGSAPARREISNDGVYRLGYFPVFIFLVRFVAPVAITLVFIYGLGLLRF
ncbi:MAG: sodium-dependent transporter [Marinilabiliales bacterium]|nr:MAG: sodium-dependent transporter [Marinilabiliales bacterium]